MFQHCTETVSVLHAIILGAGEACIDVSMGSLFWAFAAFMLLVIAAQFLARRLWARLMRPAPDPADDDTEGPVRSSRY